MQRNGLLEKRVFIPDTSPISRGFMRWDAREEVIREMTRNHDNN